MGPTEAPELEAGTPRASDEIQGKLAQIAKTDGAEHASTHSPAEGSVLVKDEVKQEDDHGAHLDKDQRLQEQDGDAEICKAQEVGHGEDHDKPIEPWSFDAVVNLFTTALLQNGAKTPTHMSKL